MQKTKYVSSNKQIQGKMDILDIADIDNQVCATYDNNCSFVIKYTHLT